MADSSGSGFRAADFVLRQKVSPASAQAARAIIEKALAESGPQTDDTKRVALTRTIAPSVRALIPMIDEVVAELRRPGGPWAAFVEGFQICGRHDLESAKILKLALALAYGEPFGYTQQNRGAVVTELQVTAGNENKQNGISQSEFDFHIDDLILRGAFRSQVISLLGVVNDARAYTGLAAPEDVIRQIDSATRQILEQPRFICRSSENYPFRNYVVSPPMSLVTTNEADDVLVVYTAGIRPADPADVEASRALTKIKRAASQVVHRLVISPGTWLIFRNETLHNRSEIKGDRLILRTYVRSNLDDLMAATGTAGPVFDARFLLLH